MDVKMIKYPSKATNHEKFRCSKTSKHQYAFSNSLNIIGGSRCSRKALYSVNGALLCKMHAGELLLEEALL
jgi:hypothetical protein